MATTGAQEGVMLLWNAFTGWFVTFSTPQTLPHSCCETCHAILSHGNNGGDEPHNVYGSGSILGDDRDPVLIDDWTKSFWWALKLDFSHSLCSKKLKEVLFSEDDDIKNNTTEPNQTKTGSIQGFEQKDSDDTTETFQPSWIVRGIPERPLYMEVAKRLLEWNQQSFSQRDSKLFLDAPKKCNVTVPANALGFKEIPFFHGNISLPSFPPTSTKDIIRWLLSSRHGEENADATIYRILGIRNTVGSLLPREKRLSMLPSKNILLRAANTLLEPKKKASARCGQHQRLTVAAKARSKHAPRAIQDDSFFGVARGPVALQNKQAEEMVQTLLENCLWINCHVFGGLTKTSKDKNNYNGGDDFSSWVLEIRQEQGYGARWRVEQSPFGDTDSDKLVSKKEDGQPQVVVTFRGFLEPQMEDGHERRWRH